MISVFQIQSYFTQTLPKLVPQISVEAFTINQQRAGIVFDFAAQVKLKGVQKTLLGGIQPQGNRHLVHQAIADFQGAGLREEDVYFVLAAPYLGESGLDTCRQHQVGGVDLAGNLLLEFDNVYIHRLVPNDNTHPPAKSPKMLFAPITSRVIRTMLEYPDRVWKIRELGRVAQASAAQVYKISEKLVEADLGKKNQAGLSLIQPATLLDSWADSYQFFRENKVVTYSVSNPISLLTELKNHAYAFTLETALALLVDRPPHAYYLYQNIENTGTDQFVAKLGQPAINGNFHLITPFDTGVLHHKQHTKSGKPLVGFVQLYLDLLASGHSQPALQLRTERLGF